MLVLHLAMATELHLAKVLFPRRTPPLLLDISLLKTRKAYLSPPLTMELVQQRQNL
jgi:hypothetical protein